MVDGITITVSCGVASAEGHDVDIRVVLAEADQALYEAKRGGRNQTRVHVPAVAVG